jgi:hypothetical protein
MGLEQLPIVSKKALVAHGLRHRNSPVYELWLRDAYNNLKKENPILYAMIEAYANQSSDPQSVRGISYTLLTLISDQLKESK